MRRPQLPFQYAPFQSLLRRVLALAGIGVTAFWSVASAQVRLPLAERWSALDVQVAAGELTPQEALRRKVDDLVDASDVSLSDPGGQSPGNDLSRAAGDVDVYAQGHGDGEIHYHASGPLLLKCATPLAVELTRWKNEDPDHVAAAKELEDRLASTLQAGAVTQLSPSGLFRLNYDVDGLHAVPATDQDANGVPDYIDRAGEAADSSYRYLVQTLGYPDPLVPGRPYDILFRQINYYGYTQSQGSTTYIVVDNDFKGFPSNDHPDGDALGALYVTIAHEFMHAIQYVINEWDGDTGSLNWVEMDATMIEEIVYDEVNDYYNYLDASSIFLSPLTPTPGAYSHATWSLYFAERFEPAFWADVWTRIQAAPNKTMKAVVDEALAPLQTSFEREHLRNHLWHMTSGNAFGGIGFGFSEKTSYPGATIARTYTTVPDSMPVQQRVQTLGAAYTLLRPDAEQFGNLRVMVESEREGLGIGMVAFFNDGRIKEQFVEESTRLYETINTDWPLEEIDRIAIVISTFNSGSNRYLLKVASDVPEEFALKPNYPNPFNPVTTIPFDLNEPTQVRIEIFNTTGRRVAVLTDQRYPAGTYAIPFDASGYASGIYLYRITTEFNRETRSMVLLK